VTVAWLRFSRVPNVISNSWLKSTAYFWATTPRAGLDSPQVCSTWCCWHNWSTSYAGVLLPASTLWQIYFLPTW
jgi:hypothetical protein